VDYKTIIYEVTGNVGRVTLNRPGQRNAQNEALILELDDALKRAEASAEVRVIVISGAGPSFSAGHDMRLYERADGSLYRAPDVEGRWDYERRMFYDKCFAIWDLPKPTIAQVQGHCLSAGLMIAGMCDLIIAADDALFGDPVCRMGAASVELLLHPWLVGVRKAKEMLYTGDPITAQEALSLGMVNRVVPRARLEEETLALAERIAKMPPFALRMAKHSLNRTLDFMGFRNALNAHFDVHQVAHATTEMHTLLDIARQQKEIKQFISDRDAPFQTPAE
jgi:enoyl-CoA hydratase